MKKYKLNKEVFALNTSGLIITLLSIISISIFSYTLFRVNIVPTKYLILGYGLLAIINFISIYGIFNLKSKIIKVILRVIILVLSIGLLYISNYFDNTYHFLDKTQNKYDTLTYSVVVLNNSKFSKIEELKSKNISYLSDEHNSEIKKKLEEIIKYKENLIPDFGELSDSLLKESTDAIVIEDGYLALINEEVEDFEDNTKVIYTFEIIIESHKEDSTVSVTEEPFILYISGIDQYGNVNSVRGRSDVNILAVVNPKTHKILLVNTPRDYYVQLAGTTGLKDKLTHAGIYGINKSIATLENVYDIDIDHYLRVNFNTLIKVVDIIGGVDIYSDKTFNSFHIKGWNVKKGWNHFDGKQALAYSRERYAYIDGDHHRGANQQQVITAIINKVSKSSVLISKYNSILNTLNGTFQTDIPTSTITSFIKYQLDKMPTWTVESTAVYGYNSYNYTYSMGYGYKLYVMEPDYKSIEEVKKKINNVLNDK